MEDKKIEIYHQNKAKEIVDGLFEAKIFRGDITRDQIQAIEDLIAYYFQSDSEATAKFVAWSTKFKMQTKQ